MKLTRLALDNVKSYAHAEIAFDAGTHAIVGHNGAGKSTILEAIGWALFDYLQGTQAAFVRDGATTASVALEIAVRDDRRYTITRKCGGTSLYAVVQEDGTKLTEGKGETVAWLQAVLGLPPEVELPTIFRDAVGVPQGLLTAAFLGTPAERKHVFGPLLQVDAYERAWANLRDAERLVEGRQNDLTTEVAVLEAEVEPMPRLCDERLRLERDAERQRGELEAVTQAVAEAQAQVAEMEDLRARFEALALSTERLSGEVAVAEAQAAQAQSAWDAAAEAHRVCEAMHPAFQQQREAQALMNDLQAAQTARERLSDKIEASQERIAEKQVRLEDLRAGQAQVDAARKELDALRPQQERLHALQEERYALASDEAAIAGVERILWGLETDLKEAQARLKEAQERVRRRAELDAQIEAAQAHHRACTEQEAQIREAGIRCTALIESLEQRVATLKDTTGTCPICQRDLTPEHAQGLLRTTEGDLQREQQRQIDLRGAWEEAHLATQDATRTLDNLQRQVGQTQGLPPTHYEAQIAEAKEKLAHHQARRAQLQTSIDRLQEIEAEMQTLSFVSAQIAQLEVRARPLNGMPAKLEDLAREIAEQERLLAGMVVERAQYEDLDARITATRQTLAATAADAQAYADHLPAAQTLDSKEIRLREVQHHLAERRTALRESRERMRAMGDQVDAGKLADLRDALLSAKEREVELRQMCRHATERLDAVRSEIIVLEAKQTSLEVAMQRANHLAHLKEVLGHMRQVIRDAGPEITKLLTTAISASAAALYEEIMQRPAHLEWTPDYEVLITEDGQTRSFGQLSGGEQMGAALAVRLALLRELSEIDVAFFDEPTVNLDAQRRESLAQQLLSVKGFGQLFVISHDDAFETGTDRVIRVHKDHGASEVA